MPTESTDRGATPDLQTIEPLLDVDVALDNAEWRTMNRVLGVSTVSAFNSSI
jgi:hypothetical protein